MTSYIGSAWIQELGQKDPAEMQSRIKEALRSTFKPEFLNRVDDIIIFNSLGRQEISLIIDIQLKRLQALLAERKLSIELTAAARELLFKEGYDPTYGARPLKRALQHQIQDKLALKILDGDFLPGDHILVDADWSKGVLTFEKVLAERQVH